MAVDGTKNHSLAKSYDNLLQGLELSDQGKDFSGLKPVKLADTLSSMEAQINKDLKALFGSTDSLSGDALTRVQTRLQVYMQKLNGISNLVKTMHEMVMNIIRNLR